MTTTPRPRLAPSRLLVTGVAVLTLSAAGTVAALAAAGGNGQGNSGVGNGNGGSTGTAGSTSPGKAFAVSVVSATPVAPGQRGSVTVSVTNPNGQAAVLTSLSGSVTGVGSQRSSRLPVCQASWITLGTWTGSVAVAGGARTTLTMPVAFSNTATNQDNCKGVSYTFSFTVNGRQA